MIKKYTNITSKDDSILDKILNFLIRSEESAEYNRLVKGLMLAIKDDIKNEKQTGKDSEENLQKFTNELAEEYKDLLVNKRIKNKRIKIAEVSETGKQDFIEAMKPSYQKLKNHLKEYAISGVDNSKTEILCKAVKNCITSLLDNVRVFFGRSVTINHSLNQLEAKFTMKYHGRDVGYFNEKTFASDVVNSRINTAANTKSGGF